MQERNAELELSLKIQVGDYQKEIQMLKENLQSTEEQRNKGQDVIKNLDSQKLKLMEESD